MKNSTALFVYLLIGISSLLSNAVNAETLYVTDRILLGVHQQAAEDSPVISSIPSGTAVTVLEKSNPFHKVKLADGTEGWVSNAYLRQEKPATAELDAAHARLQHAEEQNKKLSENISKLERETQARRDEVSNYKTTIKELRDKLTEKGKGQPVVDDTALKEAEARAKSLQDQVAKLEQQIAAQKSTPDPAPVQTDTDKLLQQNQEFQVRIEAALANLKGEKVPSAAELAAIRPSFPVWYWILLVALFVAGIIGGATWIDLNYRKKHGGFRI